MSTLESELNFEGAVDYHYGQFPPNNIDYKRLMKPLSRASRAMARFDQMLKTMHNSEIFLMPLRRQEAIISSRIEGTVSTMDEILILEADASDEEVFGSHTRNETIETFLYQVALNKAQDLLSDGRPLSPHVLRLLHSQLLKFGRGANKSPGEFKAIQNYLVDGKKNVLFKPIKPESLMGGIDLLFDYMNESDEELLIKTAISHVEFESLHPFLDGNGRVGRMLVTLYLWQKNVISAPHFYMSGYLEEHKDRYIDSMREVSEKGDWTSWCEFFLIAVEEQSNRNLAVAESIARLYEEMKEVFLEELSSKWSTVALDFMFTKPIFRNNVFTSDSGIPTPTAIKITRALVEKGYLKPLEEASGSRAALYSFEKLVSLLRV